MRKAFPYVKVSPEVEKALGKRVPGTRMYKTAGNQDEFVKWFDVVCANFGGCVSPGGAAARAHVSRAAVHKSMKSGKLTAFLFYAPDDNKEVPRLLRLLLRGPEIPYCYIPVSECQAWGDEVRARAERLEARAKAGALREDDEDLKAEREDEPGKRDESIEFLDKEGRELKRRKQRSKG